MPLRDSYRQDAPARARDGYLSTELNDLTQRLALLASVSGCTVSVRLLGGEHGSVIELRATRTCAAEAREYARQLTLRQLACRGAGQLAADFIREARLAFAADLRLAGPGTPRVAASRSRL